MKNIKNAGLGILFGFFGLLGLSLVVLKPTAIPGWMLLFAFLTGSVYLCQKKLKNRVFDDHALNSIQKLEFSIGGYFQGYETRTYTVSGEMVALEVIRRPMLIMEEAGPPKYYPFTKEAFITGLKELHIGEWKKSYYNPGVCDGTQWELKIFFDGDRKPVEISGSNAYPHNFCQLREFLCNDPYTFVLNKLKDIARNIAAEAGKNPPGIDQRTAGYANDDTFNPEEI